MKPYRILFILLLLFSVISVACNRGEDVVATQKKKIISFLSVTHDPKLIDEVNLVQGSYDPFYTVLNDSTVYRYIENFYDFDRPNRQEVTSTSVIEITFRAYVFNYSNITDKSTPFFTNDPTLEDMLQSLGLDTTHWSFEPLKINMNSTDIINGLYNSLVGCRMGDKVKVYMTYNAVYGDSNFSTIPKDSPIAFFFSITSIE
jgi:hypothetical protein